MNLRRNITNTIIAFQIVIMEFFNKALEFINKETGVNNISKIVEPLGFFIRDGICDEMPNLYMISVSKNININDYTQNQLMYDGTILEKDTNKIVCASYQRPKDITISSLTDTDFIEMCSDGTIIRVYYYNDTIITATNRCINAEMSKWGSRTFHSLFIEIITNGEPITKDDEQKFLKKCFSNIKTSTYFFNLVHKDNRIVIKYDTSTLKLLFTINNSTLKKTVCNKTQMSIPISECKDIINNKKTRGLIITRSNGDVYKIDSYYYNLLKDVRGNVPYIHYRVIELLNDPIKLAILKDEYPENNLEIQMALQCVDKLIQKVFQLYLDTHIYHKYYVDSSNPYYTLLKRIHRHYGMKNTEFFLKTSNDVLELHRSVDYIVKTTHLAVLRKYFNWI